MCSSGQDRTCLEAHSRLDAIGTEPGLTHGTAGTGRAGEDTLGSSRGGSGRGWSVSAKRIRSHYLPSLAGRLPGFCEPRRHSGEPASILSMARLCAFADQTSLHQLAQSMDLYWQRGDSHSSPGGTSSPRYVSRDAGMPLASRFASRSLNTASALSVLPRAA